MSPISSAAIAIAMLWFVGLIPGSIIGLAVAAIRKGRLAQPPKDFSFWPSGARPAIIIIGKTIYWICFFAGSFVLSIGMYEAWQRGFKFAVAGVVVAAAIWGVGFLFWRLLVGKFLAPFPSPI